MNRAILFILIHWKRDRLAYFMDKITALKICFSATGLYLSICCSTCLPAFLAAWLAVHVLMSVWLSPSPTWRRQMALTAGHCAPPPSSPPPPPLQLLPPGSSARGGKSPRHHHVSDAALKSASSPSIGSSTLSSSRALLPPGKKNRNNKTVVAGCRKELTQQRHEGEGWDWKINGTEKIKQARSIWVLLKNQFTGQMAEIDIL